MMTKDIDELKRMKKIGEERAKGHSDYLQPPLDAHINIEFYKRGGLTF